MWKFLKFHHFSKMQEMSNFQQVQGGIEILNKCQEISGNSALS